MGKKKFYAVKVGTGGPAICLTWEQCKAAVHGVAGAVFKGFATKAEAVEYLGDAVLLVNPPADDAATLQSQPSKRPADDAATLQSQSSKRQKREPRKPRQQVPSSDATNAFSKMMSASSKRSAIQGGVRVNELAVFTDGACQGNTNVATSTNPAGWGAVVVSGVTGDPPTGGSASMELYGPVELDVDAADYMGAQVCSNNTGELSAICHALRWLADDASSQPAVICYDSEYASNQAQGLHKAHKNVLLSKKSRELLAEARKHREVRFLHVKGHSGNEWNDAADSLANKGATGLRSQAQTVVVQQQAVAGAQDMQAQGEGPCNSD